MMLWYKDCVKDNAMGLVHLKGCVFCGAVFRYGLLYFGPDAATGKKPEPILIFPTVPFLMCRSISHALHVLKQNNGFLFTIILLILFDITRYLEMLDSNMKSLNAIHHSHVHSSPSQVPVFPRFQPRRARTHSAQHVHTRTRLYNYAWHSVIFLRISIITQQYTVSLHCSALTVASQ